MTKEINIFDNKEISSFGGKSLKTNLDEAENAIAELADDFRIHNHSNTQFAWQRFVLKHQGGLRNIRQITAEINKKKLALMEAKHKHARKVIEIELLQAEKDRPSDGPGAHPRLIQADIDRLTDEIGMTLPPIEGAIKDIMVLKKAYDQIMEKHAGYTEADLEREEISYWVRRLFSQALRDLREFGTITHGNQEAIEQMGLNISKVRVDLDRYIKKELEDKSLNNKLLQKFLDDSAEKYMETINEFVGYGGFSGDIIESVLFMPKK